MMINPFSPSVTFGAKVVQYKAGLKRLWKFILVTLFLVGSWQVGSSAYLLAKAQLAYYLIDDAWQDTLKDSQNHKPWSWADTYPVAKITVPALAESRYVLEGASGRNMAFGPARTLKSGMPGQAISTIISGHNDSHFGFLEQLRINDRIEVETLDGLFIYQVDDIQVVNASQHQITINLSDELILTTCYPFNTLQTGGSQRYRVQAKRI